MPLLEAVSLGGRCLRQRILAQGLQQTIAILIALLLDNHQRFVNQLREQIEEIGDWRLGIGDYGLCALCPKIDNLFSVRGKVAVITGGATGIGRMIAHGMVESGAKVYISSRKLDVCEQTARGLSGQCKSRTRSGSPHWTEWS